MECHDLPRHSDDKLAMQIIATDIDEERIERMRRTYEPARLVEMAAIAITGLGLYHGGGHEIRDVALRDSGADYLVGESNELLEIAGRSRQRDFEAAWEERRERLIARADGFFLCVIEFETPSGRLEYVTRE
jgi:hypothetical protein